MSEHFSSLLQTSAEISVAFIGFASLIGVFFARTSGDVPTSARLALRALLDYGLLALLACGLPLLLAELPIGDAALWRLSSAVFAGTIAVYSFAASRSYYPELLEQQQIVRGRVGSRVQLFLIGDAMSVLALVVNAAGWPFGTSSSIYLAAAVFWNVCGAAVSFRGVIELAWSDHVD